MNTVAAVLAACEGEVGYTESPPSSNCNKFAPEAGLKNCTFWCDGADVAIFLREGVPLPEGCVTLSTRQTAASWKKAGQWVGPHDVEAGDQLVYCVEGRNGPGQPDHVGICAAVIHDASGAVIGVDAFEGNTSPSDHGSQGNGGGFWKKRRPISVVLGAGRPAYNTTPTPPKDEDDMRSVYFCRDHGNATSGPFFATDGLTLRTLSDDNRVHGTNLGDYKPPTDAPHSYLENLRNNTNGANIPGTV